MGTIIASIYVMVFAIGSLIYFHYEDKRNEKRNEKKDE
jgi:hypothetical protein